MAKKRSVVILVALLLLVTVCFSACITREDVEVYLDWGTYRQTVKVKHGATVNAKTVQYLDYDFVEGLYDDADYTVGYNNQKIKESRVIFVKTNTKYPLEKIFFHQIDKEFKESEVNVTMNKGFKFDSALQSAIEKNGVKIASVSYHYRESYEQIGRDDYYRLVRITLSTIGDEELFKAIRIIEQFPQVYHANPNYIIGYAVAPNDEYYQSDKLWGLNGPNGINAPSAWDITQGSKNVRVGVIDSGIARHTDLEDNVTLGWNFHNISRNTEDEYYHGTHVAGIIGAVGNNGDGVVGVNWNVTIVPIKVASENNTIDPYDVVNAIGWATDKWGTFEQIDIINYSLFGFGWVTEVLEAVKDFPGLFVWSAGNDHQNMDNEPSAAFYNLPNLISVGAIKKDGERLEYSNYGKTTVDLFAPGGDIYSTVLNNGYASKSGTSMAAPHVTGVAALLLSQYPNLTAAQLKSIIVNNVDKRDNLVDYCISGGSLNAYKALISQELHSHSYDSEYVWANARQHKAICECGNAILMGHVISISNNSVPGKYKRCLVCGGLVDPGYIIFDPNNEAIVFVTDNGSFILPNGIVVLVDEDIQAFFDGTLKFYDKNAERQ